MVPRFPNPAGLFAVWFPNRPVPAPSPEPKLNAGAVEVVAVPVKAGFVPNAGNNRKKLLHTIKL